MPLDDPDNEPSTPTNEPMTEAKREFTIENEYRYNRNSPMRWIVSHVGRYLWLPLAMFLTAVINNFAYSYIQIFVGQAFDLISTPNWQSSALLWIAGSAVGMAAIQGISGLLRNYAGEFLDRVRRRWPAPHRNLMSPPELARYWPVAQVFEPGRVCLCVSFGNEFYAAVEKRL